MNLFKQKKKSINFQTFRQKCPANLKRVELRKTNRGKIKKFPLGKLKIVNLSLMNRIWFDFLCISKKIVFLPIFQSMHDSFISSKLYSNLGSSLNRKKIIIIRRAEP